MAKVLITDGMAQEGLDILINAGHEVDVRSVSAEELASVIGDYDALVVRSATQVTDEVLAAGAIRLKIVGRRSWRRQHRLSRRHRKGHHRYQCPLATSSPPLNIPSA